MKLIRIKIGKKLEWYIDEGNGWARKATKNEIRNENRNRTREYRAV